MSRQDGHAFGAHGSAATFQRTHQGGAAPAVPFREGGFVVSLEQTQNGSARGGIAILQSGAVNWQVAVLVGNVYGSGTEICEGPDNVDGGFLANDGL